jgi:hypothetical protein
VHRVIARLYEISAGRQRWAAKLNRGRSNDQR